MSNLSIIPFLNRFNGVILNPIIALLFALSLAYFIYGVIKFLSLEDGNKEKDEAWSSILWGIVGMVIMFSVYGIIRFVLASFGISGLPAETEQFIR